MNSPSTNNTQTFAVESSHLKRFLTQLTSRPGVYQMFDNQGELLYVGKASNLKKRVSSYFTKQQAAAKTRALVSQITSIDVTVTDSETEALLLESNLIKTRRPKYNVLMRDDKSYPYIHVSAHTFPRIELYRSKKTPEKGEFFGPYPSVGAVHDTLKIIQTVFKIRNCRDPYFNARSRPCLQYQIKRCTAPCTGYISVEDYQQSVRDAVRFLQGKSQQIIDELAKRMEQAVARQAFEEAATLRDQIKSLRTIQEQQSMVQLKGDADVIAIEATPGFACIQCVTIREGRVVANQSFFPTVPKREWFQDSNALWQDVFAAFVAFYYIDRPQRIPSLIISHEALADKELVETTLRALRHSPCRIQTKPTGVKAKWLDFAQNNLRLAVDEFTASASTMKKRIEALALVLHRNEPIERMECFDISHTQGQATVASCVVFDSAGPCRRDYRRFNIHDITPGDDYAAMKQAITRRFTGSLHHQPRPDLLIIDGGKGQVAVAKHVLETLNIHTITLLGIAKGLQRKPEWDRLILPNEKELHLPPDSIALHVLQHIRDEAHRFAITAHRAKRQHASVDSSLLSIEGIGPKRRQTLLRRFGGMKELARASVAEIAKVPGINNELAQRIYQHFHGMIP